MRIYVFNHLTNEHLMKKSFSLASMMLSAGLCFGVSASGLSPASLKEASRQQQIEFGQAVPNPGFHRTVKNQLQWSSAGPVNDLSALSKSLLVRSNPQMPQKTAPIVNYNAPKAPARNISGGMPELMGCVGYADSWNVTGEGKVGIYHIGATALGEVSLQPGMLTSMGQVYAGSKYFATKPETYGSWVIGMDYNIYNTSDWSMTTVSGNYNFVARAMTFDPVSRRAYAILLNDYDYTYRLAWMDMDTYQYKEIGVVGIDDWGALMCDGYGVLYGIKRNGELVKINKQNAECTLIGQTKLESRKMTSGTIDAATGRCFYIHYTEASSDMYEINLSTAEATFLYSVPETAQVLSLFVPEKEIAAAAPAKATELTLDFDGTSLGGGLSFTIPATTAGGSLLSGSVNYSIRVNGEEKVSGKSDAGTMVSSWLSVPASGEYTFTVVLSNEAGESEHVALTEWIGYTAPAAVKKVNLTVADGMLTLTWDPVKVEGAEEGDITYRVVAYPGGETVAEGLSDTSFSTAIPESEEFNRYSFGVVAVYGDSSSPETLSNAYVGGYLPLPYFEDFEDASSADLYTFIDANGDKRTWVYNYFAAGRLMIDYSLDGPHDDWAMLHPVKLESGHKYTISCDVKGTGTYYTEKLSIAVAKGLDSESLGAAEVILPETSINSDEYETFTASFIPEESGVYYIGFHCTSGKYQNKLYLDNVSVSKGISLLAPGAVKDIAGKSDIDGAISTTLTFTAPAEDMGGNPLTELSYVAVERDGVELGKVEGAPGQKMSFTDVNPVNGTNSYTLAAYNSYGRGIEAEISVYAGFVEPERPSNVTLRYGDNTGEAVVVWEAPAFDLDGHSLKGEAISYNVYVSVNGGTPREIANGLTETSFTHQVMETDADQKFVNYIVEAAGVGGISERAISNIYPFGRPETVPARESFGGRITDYEWGAESPELSLVGWDIFQANELPFPTFDDGAVAAAYAGYLSEDNTSTLVSSLFDLSGLDKPVVSFYLYDYMPTKNQLKVYVDNGKTRTLAGAVAFEEADQDWKKKSVDLSAFKGQTVCIMLEAEIADFNIIAIDNFRICNDVDHNLAAITITAPDNVEANEEFMVTSIIENAGKQAASGYKVNLLIDGEIVKSVDGNTLEPEWTDLVVFNVALPVTSSDHPVVTVAVDYALDEEVSDNVSPEAVVKFNAPAYPAPENLNARLMGKEVELTWDAPNLDNMVVNPSVDDVEAYVPFSTGLPTTVIPDDNIGEWTTVDVDGLPTYCGVFDYPGVGEPMAFTVYNSYMQEDNVFAAHSGHQLFLSLASKPDDAGHGNDDWLISPKLIGKAQTVSFYAKSITTYGVDTFQILYSTGSKEISDFRLIAEYVTTDDWKEYSAQLPEGALYFAVRLISYDMYAFLLDDFRMIKASDVASDITVEGYNVYCDGKRVNDTLIDGNSFIHMPEEIPGHVYRYNVSCVFNYGESLPSETKEVLFTATGVDEAASAAGVSVTALRGRILVKGAAGQHVSVADSFGRVLHSGVADGDLSLSVPAGIYVVKAGKATVKTVVR